MLFALFNGGVDASVCRSFSAIQNDAGVSNEPPDENASSTVEYTCPGPGDPKHFTECCSSSALQGCCAQARYFYEIDKTLATVIAVSVTLAFVIFTTTIIVCCFWSRCPLYSACRVQYSPEIATYVSKEDNVDMDTMPREISRKNHNKFTPAATTNGNLPVGSEIEYV